MTKNEKKDTQNIKPRVPPKENSMDPALLSKISALVEHTETILAENADKDARIAELEKAMAGVKGNSGKRTMPKPVTERTCRVLFWEGKLVIGYVNKAFLPGLTRFVYLGPDPSSPLDTREFVDLIIDNGEKSEVVKGIDYVNFLHTADRVDAKILSVEKKSSVKSFGEVEKMEYEDWNSKSMGYMVPLDVTSQVSTFLLKLPDVENDDGTVTKGREVNMPEKMVNA